NRPATSNSFLNFSALRRTCSAHAESLPPLQLSKIFFILLSHHDPAIQNHVAWLTTHCQIRSHQEPIVMSTRETIPCCRRTNLKGRDQLIIETAAGQRITLLDSPGSILVEDSNGNSIRIESSGITIQAAA